MTLKLLNKSDGLLNNISPTGNQYKVIQVEHNNALWRIWAPIGLPQKLSGFYTSAGRAQADLTQYLLTWWEETEAEVAKRRAKSS